MLDQWLNGFAVVTGMVETGRGLWERGPGYRVVEAGLTLKAARLLAAEVGGVVMAPGAAD